VPTLVAPPARLETRDVSFHLGTTSETRYVRTVAIASAILTVLLALTTATAAPPPPTTLAVTDWCADPTHDRRITAADARTILSAAVELEYCSMCECDLDDSGAIEMSDALAALHLALGLPAGRVCPACDPAGPCDPSRCDPATSFCSTLLPGVCCGPPFEECLVLPDACATEQPDCTCVLEATGMDLYCYCEQAGDGIVNVVCAAP